MLKTLFECGKVSLIKQIHVQLICRGGSTISSLGGLIPQRDVSLRYNDTNDLNKQYFTVLMKTVLQFPIKKSYRSYLVSDSHVFILLFDKHY